MLCHSLVATDDTKLKTVLKLKYSLERQNWGITFRIQLMQQQVIDKFWKKMCVGHVANPFEVSC